MEFITYDFYMLMDNSQVKKIDKDSLRGAERVCASSVARSEIQTAMAWPREAQHGF